MWQTKDEGLVIEMTENVGIVTDQMNNKYYYLQIPKEKLDEIIASLPSPMLEGLFQMINMTLQERDRRAIEETL